MESLRVNIVDMTRCNSRYRRVAMRVCNRGDVVFGGGVPDVFKRGEGSVAANGEALTPGVFPRRRESR
jgi:hypothetical protein